MQLCTPNYVRGSHEDMSLPSSMPCMEATYTCSWTPPSHL